MERLTERCYNSKSMLELVRCQKKEIKLATSAEKIVASASDILESEIDRRIKSQKSIAKYEEQMNVELELKANKIQQ